MQQRFAALKRTVAATSASGNQAIARGDYQTAEHFFDKALQQWRQGGGIKEEEGELILQLGKCYVAQRKYEPAYDLYMQALNYLTGTSYDEVYASFLYLNERMGTFTKKEPPFAAF